MPYFEDLFDHMPDGVLVARVGTTFARANRAACTMLGYSEAELQRMTQRDIVVDDAAVGALVNAPARGDVVKGEIVLRRADGSVFPAELTSILITGEGEPMGFVIFRDISERKAAESRIAESTEALRAVLDAVPAAVWIARDPNADHIDANRFGAALLRDAPGRNFSKSAPEHERPQNFRTLRDGEELVADALPLQRSARSGEVVRDFEFDLVFDDGDVVHLLGNSEPLRDTDGRARGAVGAFIDITSRKESERALIDAVARFDAFMDALPSAAWITNDGGQVIFANAAFPAPSGGWRGQTASDVFPEDVARLIREADEHVLRTGLPLSTIEDLTSLEGIPHWRQTTRFRMRDGRGNLYVGGISSDVTSQKLAEDALRASEATSRQALVDLEQAQELTRKTEEKFRQSQKMEAIGRLAGGVAHDFNNLLTIILGNAELLATMLGNDPLAEDVGEIRKAGERAAALTRQLLAFSRRQPLEPRLLDLNDVLSGMRRMLERTLGEDIQLKLVLHPALDDCLVDPGQMEQVVLNLVINARDAMPDGGHLTIETSNVEIDAEYVQAHPEARPGPHVLLTVSDSGMGMSPEVKSRLFEPFFTTKSLGKGTGLGLSTVYGIVQQSGGTIWVYSEEGHGTTMKVYLPVATAGERETSTPRPANRSLTGTETILLVEDDVQVRATIARMLRVNSYHVIEASNGGEALLICEQHGGRIDLLLTDIVMPRMNGRQLAERLFAVRPTLRVIYMSGYTENVVVHHGVVDSGVNFLAKPLTSETLLPKVRDVLDR